jgi:hypothetical protein
MEAAAWLAGEPWSDHPRSVHRAVAAVARRVNDGVSDDVRQTLWALVLASLDTARPRHPVLSFKMSRCASKALSAAGRHGDLPRAWRDVLDEHARLFAQHRTPLPRARLESLTAHADCR